MPLRYRQYGGIRKKLTKTKSVNATVRKRTDDASIIRKAVTQAKRLDKDVTRKRRETDALKKKKIS